MKYRRRTTAAGFALAALLPSASALAQAGRTFVSPTGNDTNPCTLVAPCRNFQAAIAKTNAGGEVAVLGTAGYNGGATVVINKAISIVNPGGYEAAIGVPSGGTGIQITAGANDAVSLRGLTIEGAGVGTYGILFTSGASLTVQDCVVRHNTLTGIYFAPTAASQLSVSHSVASDNSVTGIYVRPTGTNQVTAAMFNQVETNNNVYGIALDGSSSTGGSLRGAVADSVASGNSDVNFYALNMSGGTPTALSIFHSVAANAVAGVGLLASGPNAVLLVDQSMVTGNSTGWQALNGGSVLSYGNNGINGNGGNEGPPPGVALK